MRPFIFMMDENFAGKMLGWQQFSAPAHKAKIVQKWCGQSYSAPERGLADGCGIGRLSPYVLQLH